jgi:hypothetical protein
MKGELQKRGNLGRGKEVFIGVGAHKESWHVTARAEGEEVFHGSIPSQYHALRELKKMNINLLQRSKGSKSKIIKQIAVESAIGKRNDSAIFSLSSLS